MSDSDEPRGIGDNSEAANDEFVALLERIERLEEEKKGVADDIKDVYTEGKARGYDTKMMRYTIAMRKLQREEREELLALQETYLRAAGLA